MIVEPLRPTQIAAGMQQHKDPKEHLKPRFKDGIEVQVTTLPPADGDEREYVCMVKRGCPLVNFTELGVDFSQDRWENRVVMEGVPHEKRHILNTHRLSANQVEALRMRIAGRRVSGFTGKMVKDENGNEIAEQIDNVPLENFVILKLYNEPGSVGDRELDKVSAENRELREKLEAAERELTEARAMARAIAPPPKKS